MQQTSALPDLKVGISAFAWTAHFEPRHVRLVAQVRDAGYGALEIPMFVPSALPIKELRGAFAETGVTCTVCAILPAGINPISPDPATRKRSALHLAACVEAAAEMGAQVLGGPLFAPIGYLPGHRPTEDERQYAVEAFQSLGGLLDATGMTLALEPVNRSETHFLRTAAEAAALLARIGHPRVGVTIDTFHANIEELDIAAAVTSLGPHVRHMHLSENDRSLLGRGHVDFPAVIAALRNLNYEGILMVEGFGFDPAEPQAPGYLWGDPQVSPERLTAEALRYLRGLLG